MLSLLSVISDNERASVNTLLKRVQRGDSDALSDLYTLIGGRLLSVAVGITRNREIAEDILHDAFINAVRFSFSYRPNTNGYAWLCRIVRNTAINKVKSESLRRGADVPDLFNMTDEGSSLYQDNLYAADVKAALSALTPRERTLVWLRYYNDMTVREIAVETGIKRSTAQDMLKKAEEKLRGMLK